MVNAWNRMVDLYGNIPTRGYLMRPIQPEADLYFDSLPSCYNYMVANIELFPDWIFTPLKPVNSFLI
jgi:hypothetical protein